MTDTLDGLLRAILVNPADDLPRLVYADALEEHDGEVDCWNCGNRAQGWVHVGYGDYDRCPHCSGTGRVGNGFAERAEFIRVQVELARLKCTRVMNPCPKNRDPPLPMDCPNCRRAIPLRRRERELIGRYGHEWAGPALPLHGEFRRGFVESLHCTLAAFLEHAPAVFGGQPVVSVTLADREPYTVGAPGNGGVNYWWSVLEPGDPREPGRSGLPGELRATGGFSHGPFPTRDAALQALSTALVRFGRAAAAGWTHQGTCEGCKGSGSVYPYVCATPAGDIAKNCPDCKGTGTRTLPGLPPPGEMSHGAH